MERIATRSELRQRPEAISEYSSVSASSEATLDSSGLVDKAEIESWLAARVSAQTCVIGHEDVFARL